MSAQHTQGRVKVQHPHAGERGWEVAFEPGLDHRRHQGATEMTDHFPDVRKMVPNDRQVNILTDELHNANEDVKRFREAASCERDVRRVLEKQVGTLQSEVRRLHEENEALRAMSFDTKRDMKTEALLWLCREMIRELPVVHSEQWLRRNQLIQALDERLSNG